MEKHRLGARVYLCLVCAYLLFNPYLMTMISFKSEYFTCIKLTPVGCRVPPLLLHINGIVANTELHLETLNTVIKAGAWVGCSHCDAV